MRTSDNGKALIKKYEGCKLKAYKCPAGVPTIGYGNTYYFSGVKVSLGDTITQDEAEKLLTELLPKYENTVKRSIHVELNQNQFDALVSFCWNCGSSRTLFKLINEKSDHKLINEWWRTHYIRGGGVVLKGLIRRRLEEADLFIK